MLEKHTEHHNMDKHKHLGNIIWFCVMFFLLTKCVSLSLFLCDFLGRIIEQWGGGRGNESACDVSWCDGHFHHLQLHILFMFVYVLTLGFGPLYTDCCELDFIYIDWICIIHWHLFKCTFGDYGL